jgi:aminoglycoside phosphotransferase family enzyme
MKIKVRHNSLWKSSSNLNLIEHYIESTESKIIEFIENVTTRICRQRRKRLWDRRQKQTKIDESDEQEEDYHKI